MKSLGHGALAACAAVVATSGFGGELRAQVTGAAHQADNAQLDNAQLDNAQLDNVQLDNVQLGSAPSGNTQSSASNVEMTSDSYKPVRRPPKPNATPLMSDKQVELFERELACPCPCTLDVYTCRTTDFTCSISPAVHRDVQSLVNGGYSADEIMVAMTDTYGDFILMTPRKQGFNLLASFAPFAAIGLGAISIGAMLRSWRRNAAKSSAFHANAAAQVAADRAMSPTSQSEGSQALFVATPDELARLDASLRHDGQQ